jgi:hypothetical protein
MALGIPTPIAPAPAVTAGAERRDPPVRVAADAAGSGWAALLATEVDQARERVGRFLDRELIALRRAVAPPSGRPGVVEPPAPADPGAAAGPAERLGTGLQALSVALAAEVRAAVGGVLAAVLGRVLVAPSDPSTLTRVRAVLRDDVAERCSGLAVCYRALRVTATGAAAVATSREPVASLAAHAEHAEHADAVLPPLGVGLTTNCLPVVRALASGSALGERDWVNRAVASLAPVLGLELDHQFGALRAAIEDLVAEGLDHDMLLI